MDLIYSLGKILVFPGFGFLVLYSLFAQYLDRKLYARMQNRVGPPLIQPLADIVKLFSKETIVPRNVDIKLFRLLPFFAFAGVATSFLFIPVFHSTPIYSYPGDLVIVAYLLTIPTMVLALSGWVSCTAYSIIGGIRCISQLFAYEVPFFLALLTPALLLETWNITEISKKLPSFLLHNPVYIIPCLISFIVAIIALQGKLERKPFDIPDAETEIVAGPFTEYSGRLFGIFRITLDMELIAGVSLVSAIFLGGANPFFGIPAIVMYLLKTLFVLSILIYIKASVARIRIDQMISFGWLVLAPSSLTSMLLVVILHKGGLL
jgi:NADH-quinone oxidoreductase subunit H